MKKSKFYLIGLTIICFLVLFSGNVFAKYYINYKEKVTTKVAEPIIEISKKISNSSPDSVQNEVVTKEKGVELILSISNFNSTNISEVGQNYYLFFYSDDIDTSKLNINVKKEDEDISITEGKSKIFKLVAKTKQTDDFCINISCRENTNNTMNGKIKVKVVNEQIEPV